MMEATVEPVVAVEAPNVDDVNLDSAAASASKRVTRSASAAAAAAVTLGGQQFKTSFELQGWLHDVIHERYAVDQELNAADFAVALDVLRHHPNAATKMGSSGVRAIAVRLHPSFNNRCLTLLRNDGSVEDFSATRCVEVIFSLQPPPSKQHRVLIETPNVVVKLHFTIVSATAHDTAVPTAEEGAATVPATATIATATPSAIAEIKTQLLNAMMEAAGGVEGAAVAVDVMRGRPFVLVRMRDSDAAESAVAALRRDRPKMSFTAEDWIAQCESPEVATGNDEKAFWERSIKTRETNTRARRGRGRGGRGGTTKSTAAVIAEPVPTTATEIIPPVTSTLNTPTTTPMAKQPLPQPVVAIGLPKKAPRVTPTEGQSKRPATAVGLASGKPPTVICKRAKQTPSTDSVAAVTVAPETGPQILPS